MGNDGNQRQLCIYMYIHMYVYVYVYVNVYTYIDELYYTRPNAQLIFASV